MGKNNADAVMILDIIEKLLTLSHDLQAAGTCLTDTLWELTGAFAIFLMVDSAPGTGKHRNISVTPKRKYELVDHLFIEQLANEARKLSRVKFISMQDGSIADLNWQLESGCTIENAIIAPLAVANEYLGCLLILELPPDDVGKPTMLKAIETLTGILSLVLRISLLHEKQEEVIALRTSELRQSNTDLELEIDRRKQVEELLHNYNISLEKNISIRTEQLREKNLLLEKEICERIHAEKELKNATAQLIQTEKLVSIGQLAAGVAHEVNNPLGAIGSSNTSIKDNFRCILNNFKCENDILDKHGVLIEEVIKAIETDSGIISSRQARQAKKEMTQKLMALNINEPDEVADLLTSIAIYSDYEQFLPLFTDTDRKEIQRFLYSIAAVIKGTKIIDLAVNQSSRVVSALKDFARSDENIEITKTNIKETIDTALILYGNTIKHGIDLKLNLTDTPAIYGYPHKLCQVWSNLIQNAVQAMSNHGTLEITMSQVADNIQVTISDTGPGIDPDIIDKIFDPLFTTKNPGEGTGLGLNIAKRIVEMHNGSISVQSQPGMGAIFTVLLPLPV